MSSRSKQSSIVPTFTEAHYFSHYQQGWVCNLCTPLGRGHVKYMTSVAAMRHEASVKHAQLAIKSEHKQNIQSRSTNAWNKLSDLDRWDAQPDLSGWHLPIVEDPPLTVEEMKIRENRIHVDNVRDMVPFWIRGVEAAERGEILKLEDFLESLQRDQWHDQSTWELAYPAEGWGNPGRNEGGNAGGWGTGELEGDVSSGRGWDKEWESVEGTKSGRSTARTQPRDQTVAEEESPQNMDDVSSFVEDIARHEHFSPKRKREMYLFYRMPTDEKLKKIKELINYLRYS